MYESGGYIQMEVFVVASEMLRVFEGSRARFPSSSHNLLASVVFGGFGGVN